MRLFLFAVLMAAFRQEAPTVTEKPLPLDHSSKDRKTVDTVVLHFMSDMVANPASPYDLERVLKLFDADGRKTSAHYLIDRKGAVYRLVDEGRSAWHAGAGSMPSGEPRKDALNLYSIGIELMGIGTFDEMKATVGVDQKHYDKVKESDRGFTKEQYASLSRLIDDIVKRRPDVKRDRRRIIGHQEYAPNRKHDPGALFDWSKIGLTQKP